MALKLITPVSAGSRPAVIFMAYSCVRPVCSCFSLCQILIIWGENFHAGCCWRLPKLNVWFVFGQKLLSCLWEGVWGKQGGGLRFFSGLFFWRGLCFFSSGKQTTVPLSPWRGMLLWERSWGKQGLLLLQPPGTIRDLSLWNGVQRQIIGGGCV